MTAAGDLARWALSLHPADVPASASHAAKRHILDGIGCALAAGRSGEGRAAIDVARTFGVADEASIIGSGQRVSAMGAALANGTLIHALDYDDTHAGALIHATAAVLPAVLAVGESRRASGAETLLAAIAGYEAVTRIGAAVPYGFHAEGFHATSVCGVFAAALVAARMMRLDEAAATNALGIAGSLASGSLEFLHTGSSTKQLHPGFAGMNGILAARLAAEGADGPSSILEGTYGIYTSMLGERIEGSVVTRGLGQTWEVERITIKPYPACQLSHASLDALRTLLPKLTDTGAIERISFVVPESSVPIVCEPAPEKLEPRTPYEGKFSLPYCAAALLSDGTLGVDSFSPQMLKRPDLRALASRVAYQNRRFNVPAADAPGSVEVVLAGGETLRGEVRTSRGGPGAPLSDEEVLAKFLANGGSESTAHAILSLENESDLRRVFS